MKSMSVIITQGNVLIRSYLVPYCVDIFWIKPLVFYPRRNYQQSSYKFAALLDVCCNVLLLNQFINLSAMHVYVGQCHSGETEISPHLESCAAGKQRHSLLEEWALALVRLSFPFRALAPRRRSDRPAESSGEEEKKEREEAGKKREREREKDRGSKEERDSEIPIQPLQSAPQISFLQGCKNVVWLFPFLLKTISIVTCSSELQSANLRIFTRMTSDRNQWNSPISLNIHLLPCKKMLTLAGEP
ncbi:uncharacterized protein LOC141543968 [Sminthopsis crassicaudata]|uniref:uncharacterized protein LOC141543968 n=1 Tax=Sminthopsis crassicaudata TaxID=9301 RepID=UPI003D68C93A